MILGYYLNSEVNNICIIVKTHTDSDSFTNYDRSIKEKGEENWDVQKA